MTTNGKLSSSRVKLALALAAIPVLVGGWWAFRPEKLWVNQQVNEAAPVSLNGEPQALYTGKLEGKTHGTSGRATIYKDANGKQYLRLTDFATSNGPDVHVLLVNADDPSLMKDVVAGDLNKVELGALRGNRGDQNYDLPADVNLEKYQAVAIYCERFHAIFGVARLDKF